MNYALYQTVLLFKRWFLKEICIFSMFLYIQQGAVSFFLLDFFLISYQLYNRIYLKTIWLIKFNWFLLCKNDHIFTIFSCSLQHPTTKYLFFIYFLFFVTKYLDIYLVRKLSKVFFFPSLLRLPNTSVKYLISGYIYII